MTAAASFSDNSPQARLSLTRDLARRVRHEQRATWFPLLVFALVTYLAIPVTRAGHPTGLVCRKAAAAGPPDVRVCVAHNSAAYVYWPIALIAAYVLIAGFYLWMADSRGVGTRIRPYVIIGLVLAVVVIAASVWASHRVLTGGYDIVGWHVQGPELYRLIAPGCAIGLALLVLAVIDRSPTLFAVTSVYLIVVIGRIDLGWTTDQRSPWAFAPHLVIQGSLLLLASVGFALMQRPRRHEGTPSA
jgi:hypothetical protein